MSQPHQSVLGSLMISNDSPIKRNTEVQFNKLGVSYQVTWVYYLTAITYWFYLNNLAHSNTQKSRHWPTASVLKYDPPKDNAGLSTDSQLLVQSQQFRLLSPA